MWCWLWCIEPAFALSLQWMPFGLKDQRLLLQCERTGEHLHPLSLSLAAGPLAASSLLSALCSLPWLTHTVFMQRKSTTWSQKEWLSKVGNLLNACVRVFCLMYTIGVCFSWKCHEGCLDSMCGHLQGLQRAWRPLSLLSLFLCTLIAYCFLAPSVSLSLSFQPSVQWLLWPEQTWRLGPSTVI